MSPLEAIKTLHASSGWAHLPAVTLPVCVACQQAVQAALATRDLPVTVRDTPPPERPDVLAVTFRLGPVAICALHSLLHPHAHEESDIG